MNALHWFYGTNWHDPARFERPVPLVEGIDCADEREIVRRAEDAAREEYDETTRELVAWLSDDCQPHLVGIIVAAIRASVTAYDADAKLALDRAVQVVRDLYVQQHRDCHRKAAEESVLRPIGDCDE